MFAALFRTDVNDEETLLQKWFVNKILRTESRLGIGIHKTDDRIIADRNNAITFLSK